MARKKVSLGSASLGTRAQRATVMVVAQPFPVAKNVRLENRIRELTQLHGRATEQVRALEQQTGDLDRRYTELARLFEGLQPALTTAHQRLTSHRVEIETLRRDLTRFQYEQLIPRVRTMVEATLPLRAIALVVSKGDERLVTFNGRTGWHFLRNEKGVYAGHHPADSATAITAIERWQAEGAGYLVIPQVAFWWLNHYTGLRDHLEKRARVVARHDRTAVIYALARPGARR